MTVKELITPRPSENSLRQLGEVTVAGARGSSLSTAALQRALSRGNELQRELRKLLLELQNPYRHEKVGQTHFYPKGWSVPDLDSQVRLLGDAFPGLDLAYTVPQVAPSKDADGLALVVKLAALGRIFAVDDCYGAGYGRIVGRVLETIGSTRSFYNYRQGELGPEYVRLFNEVIPVQKDLERKLSGDVMVLPVSLGNQGSAVAAVQRPAFRWWLLSVIIGAAVVLIAATIAGILIRRHRMVRELSRHPRMHTKGA